MLRDWVNLRSVVVTLLLASTTAEAFAQENCPFLPAFKALRQQVDAMSESNAVAALQKYVATHDNPEGCELTEIDRLLGEKERSLINLELKEAKIPAQIVFRCNRFDPRTAQCQSPMEDGTAHGIATGISPKPFPSAGSAFRVTSKLPAAKLVGLYRIALSDALDSKTASRLGSSNTGKWQPTRTTSALIAIYKTKGPWAYRKAVWYFDDK